MDLEAMGRRMRAAREALGLTQAQVAKAIGRSLLFYGYIERGTRRMSLVTFSAVALALDISADELLGLEEFRHKKELRVRKPLETTR
jgi:transcriptional regulator with XRE-family HTH domain